MLGGLFCAASGLLIVPQTTVVHVVGVQSLRETPSDGVLFPTTNLLAFGKEFTGYKQRNYDDMPAPVAAPAPAAPAITKDYSGAAIDLDALLNQETPAEKKAREKLEASEKAFDRQKEEQAAKEAQDAENFKLQAQQKSEYASREQVKLNEERAAQKAEEAERKAAEREAMAMEREAAKAAKDAAKAAEREAKKAKQADAPSFSAPSFSAPSFSAPSFSAPKVDLPSFSVPKVCSRGTGTLSPLLEGGSKPIAQPLASCSHRPPHACRACRSSMCPSSRPLPSIFPLTCLPSRSFRSPPHCPPRRRRHPPQPPSHARRRLSPRRAPRRRPLLRWS